MPPLKQKLHSLAACVVHDLTGNDTIWVVGGMGDDGVPGHAVQVLVRQPVPCVAGVPGHATPRALLALVPFQDGLWAMSGIGPDGTPTRTVEKFFTEVPQDAPPAP